MDRYARQQAIDGWDQSVLTKTTLVIAGHGRLAFLTALMGAAMGFGGLVLVSARGTGPAKRSFRRLIGSDVETWREVMEQVNPEVATAAVRRPMDRHIADRLRDLGPLIIADNDPAHGRWQPNWQRRRLRRLREAVGARSASLGYRCQESLYETWSATRRVR